MLIKYHKVSFELSFTMQVFVSLDSFSCLTSANLRANIVKLYLCDQLFLTEWLNLLSTWDACLWGQ